MPSDIKKNAAYLFGEKVAADAIPPKPITMARVRAADAAAQAKGFGGSVMGAFVHDPKDWQVTRPAQRIQAPRPAPQTRPYTPPSPEIQRQTAALSQQFPQFGKGDVADVVAMHQQKRPAGEIMNFINNTTKHYQQYPQRAANYGR
jgi:hypothetical protein